MAAENKFVGSKDEKLYFLHNEIEKLTNTCLNRNISYFQIKKSANLFLRFERKKTISPRTVLKTLIFTAVFVCLIAIAFHAEPSKRLVNSYGRHVLIKALPLFDWTCLHGVNCFIPNYFNEGDDRPLEAEDCQNCSRIMKIDVLLAPTMEEIANSYLYKDIPVIVQHSGQAPDKVDIEDIIKLYLDNDVMRLFTSCNFESNVKVKKKDHRTFLEGIRSKDISQYYAHWENCFKEAAKLFRSVYKRPEFLPFSVELTASNWIFLCSNYTENKNLSFQLPYEEQIIVLVQLSGNLDISLRPREPCGEDCKSIHASIPEGGALFVTDFFYDIEYARCNQENSITVGLGGKLDI
ncbi:uncharacterized protein LOC123523208 [Mercenaria mercenaria]|uniref:uncharacterized protein LOC123523208 n=1 Tax=Mercenaria mercenaria TaxID=6596 RepID=UPI001E1D42CC|nr:uncharacterized protein LOC123523208 [Mercenaria mercenaria]